MRGSHVLLRSIEPENDAEPLFLLSHLPEGDAAIWTYLRHGPFEDLGSSRSMLASAASSKDPCYFVLAALPGERPLVMASYLRITPGVRRHRDRPHLARSAAAAHDCCGVRVRSGRWACSDPRGRTAWCFGRRALAWEAGSRCNNARFSGRSYCREGPTRWPDVSSPGHSAASLLGGARGQLAGAVRAPRCRDGKVA